MRRVLVDLEEAQSGATCINCDNQSAIKLAHNPVYHARTKHVELQYYFVREKIMSKEIGLIFCNTKDNVADIFTKPLCKIKFEVFRSQLGIVENPFSIKGGCENNAEIDLVRFSYEAVEQN